MQRTNWWLILVGALLVTTGFIWQAADFYTTSKSQAIASSASSVKVSEKLTQKAAPLPPTPAKITETVPILMFHYIRDYTNPDDQLGIGLSVSPARFEEDLIALKTAGYQTISLDDFYHHQLKPKSVILTFDDGYSDHFTDALPALQRQGMTGTFFIIHGFISAPNYMTADQIAQLKAAGMEIGDHTVRHRDLAVLSYSTAYQEIIGGEPGITAKVFAYPSGEYNTATVTILQQLGMELAVTTKLGIATNLSPLLELPRVRIKQTTDVVGAINQQLALIKQPVPAPAASQTN